MWVHVDSQAKPIIYWMQGSYGRLDCGCRLSHEFLVFSRPLCHQSANQPCWCFMCHSPPGKGQRLTGISHVTHIPEIHHRGWQKGWDEGSLGIKGKKSDVWNYCLGHSSALTRSYFCRFIDYNNIVLIMEVSNSNKLIEVLSHQGHGNTNVYILGNWTCFSFLKSCDIAL